MTADGSEAFWKAHYEALAASGPRWLDYSNERTQAQTLALALEAAGPLDGKDVLDVGCGRGQLSLSARAMGARHVTGVDLAEAAIRQNERAHPGIEWVIGSAGSLAIGRRYDVVLAVEVLQYVSHAEAIRRLWNLVAPAGRLVVIVPNRACPIVERVMARFEGRFAPPSGLDLRASVELLPELSWWRARGLFFREDQSVAPYEASPWGTEAAWQAPPNRLQLTARRA